MYLSIYANRLIIRNSLMQLFGLRRPKVGSRQAGDLGRDLMFQSSMQARKGQCPSSHTQARGFLSLFSIFKNQLIDLLLAMLGHPCCAGAPRCSGFSCCGALALGRAGSGLAVGGLSYPMTCGIFLDQGSNLCLLR